MVSNKNCLQLDFNKAPTQQNFTKIHFIDPFSAWPASYVMTFHRLAAPQKQGTQDEDKCPQKKKIIIKNKKIKARPT